MNWIDGGVTAPAGFRASGVFAGIKKKAELKDCALIVSDTTATVAGLFTRNIMRSPPVVWDEEVCARGTARAVFTNSGNANACTGDRGHADVRATAEWLGAALNEPASEMCICSTGVIGVPLPMDRIQAGVTGCVERLSREGSHDAARAIMTTDTRPKEFALEIALPDGSARLGAIAKGSGMIAPNMATMIALITTDAAVPQCVLRELLTGAVEGSFNRMCVDNDMSTSDTVLCLANGQSGTAAIEDSHGPAAAAFAEGLNAICLEAAKAIVRDGEGATKFIEIRVSGAKSDEDALKAARAIAHSQLCKTAFFGQDPNWGRLACAAGYSGADFQANDLDIYLNDVKLLAGGQPADYQEKDAAAVMEQPEFQVRIVLGAGPGAATFWTSDLSHDYVSINADYRS